MRRTRTAFTLVELLVVIGIIGLLAGMVVALAPLATTKPKIKKTQAELNQLVTVIEAYKDKLGYYPPDNRNPVNSQLYPGLNQLYYELAGTVLTGSNAYITKDGIGPALAPIEIGSFFGPGVVGFVNSDRGNTDDDGRVALQLLKTFRPPQIVLTTISNPATRLIVSAKLLVCTVPGKDPNNPPLTPALNPWRYNSSSPTNNSTSYDLWTDIYVSGKTIRICNWSSHPLVVQ